MKNKILGLFLLSVLALTFVVGAVSAVTLSQWNLTSVATADVVDTNLMTPSSLTTGSGVAAFTTGSFTSPNGATVSGWDQADIATAITANDYYQVSLSPKTGFDFTINSLSFNYRATSVTGPVTFVLQWSKDVSFSSSSSTNITIPSQTIASATPVLYTSPALNIAVNDGATIYLRWYAFGGTTGTFSLANLNVQGTTSSNLPQKVLDCIATTNQGNNLAATIDDVSIETGYGNSDEWYPLDTVKVRVNVENSGNNKIKTIKVNWGLYDVDTGKFVIQGSESTFDLKDGDNQNVNFKFKLDNVKKLNDNKYKFYTWTTAKDQEFSTNNSGNTCAVDSQDVTPQIDSDFIVLDNIQTPETVQCSQDVLISADIWNIGSSDETDVYVLANNKILGLNDQRVNVGDVNSLEKTLLSFTAKIPAGLDEKTYSVQLTVYDRHDRIFENNKNDKPTFNAILNVKGGCFTVGKAAVTAGLQSDAVEGKSLVIKSVVTNSGTKSAQFIVSPEGYSAWASSATVDVPTFSLDAGQSKEVTITLQAKQGSMGQQTLDIKVLSGNQVVMTQPVSVLVSRAGFISALTGGAIGGTSSLWIVGALNVILVFAIIIIAIRFFRK